MQGQQCCSLASRRAQALMSNTSGGDGNSRLHQAEAVSHHMRAIRGRCMPISSCEASGLDSTCSYGCQAGRCDARLV